VEFRSKIVQVAQSALALLFCLVLSLQTIWVSLGSKLGKILRARACWVLLSDRDNLEAGALLAFPNPYL
jgi:hypothetical protein